jgi:cell wall-associated NlpC family hydrolase
MPTTFVVGPGIARAMTDDATTPASDEIFVHGNRAETQWSEAMGENGKLYRWVKATNTVHRYSSGPRQVTLAAKLQTVVDAGLAKGHRPYSGPIVGQPESFRHGDPGYDCSSFVSLMYQEALGITLAMFTDAIADETDTIATADALPGDIILYRYVDEGQPGVMFPHTGLWLGDGEMLDCQLVPGLGEFEPGLGVHPMLKRPFQIHRARAI